MAGEFGQHAASQNATLVASEVENADDGVAKSRALAEIKVVIEELLIDEHYEQLHVGFKKEHSEWSSDREIEYLFHYACRCVRSDEVALDFIEAVIKECLNLETQDGGCQVLKYLFELEDPDGYVPFVLAILHQSERYLKDFLTRMRPDSNSSYSILLNACDRRKWRPIHMIVTRFTTHEILKELVKGKVDVNARLPSSKATALHLAIYHDRPEAVKIILEADSVDVNAILERNIVYGSKRKNGMKRSSRYWSPLQLAAIMGRADVVRILLTKIGKIYDSSKRSNQGLTVPDNYDGNIPALHLAAASGVPEVIRMFITKEFDPIQLTPDKRTPIHFAIDSSTAKFNNEVEVAVEVEVKEKSNDTIEESSPMTNPGTCVDPFAIDTKTRPDKELCPRPAGDDEGRPACITMLMQAGVDIWQEDDEDTLAEPGPEASPIVRKWWYEAIARDTSEAKKNLNDAAIAISLVAALVATASNYSWHGSGLAFYPTMFGGLICLFGILTFFVRLLRLVFDKNKQIRRLYQKLPKV